MTDKTLPNDVDLVFEVPADHPPVAWRNRELRELAQHNSSTRSSVKKRMRVHAFTTTAAFVHHGVVTPILIGLQRVYRDQPEGPNKGIVEFDLSSLAADANLGQ